MHRTLSRRRFFPTAAGITAASVVPRRPLMSRADAKLLRRLLADEIELVRESGGMFGPGEDEYVARVKSLRARLRRV